MPLAERALEPAALEDVVLAILDGFPEEEPAHADARSIRRVGAGRVVTSAQELRFPGRVNVTVVVPATWRPVRGPGRREAEGADDLVELARVVAVARWRARPVALDPPVHPHPERDGERSAAQLLRRRVEGKGEVARARAAGPSRPGRPRRRPGRSRPLARCRFPALRPAHRYRRRPRARRRCRCRPPRRRGGRLRVDRRGGVGTAGTGVGGVTAGSGPARATRRAAE